MATPRPQAWRPRQDYKCQLLGFWTRLWLTPSPQDWSSVLTHLDWGLPPDTVLRCRNSGTRSGCEFQLPGRAQGRFAPLNSAPTAKARHRPQQLSLACFTSQHSPPDTHFLALEPLVHEIARSTDSLALELTLPLTRQHQLPALARPLPSEHHRRHACNTLQCMHNAAFTLQHNPGI